MFCHQLAPAPIPDAVLDAALALAAEGDWSSVSLVDVAVRAGMSIDDIFAVVPDKAAILDAVSRRADASVLASGLADAADSPHDRLFDILMRRFDAHLPYRVGLKNIAKAVRRDPFVALRLASRLRHSMAWMLEAARLSSHGATGALQAKVLATVWLRTLEVWFNDDSTDMAQTMAALDASLRQADTLLNSLRRGFDRTSKTPPPVKNPSTDATA